MCMENMTRFFQHLCVKCVNYNCSETFADVEITSNCNSNFEPDDNTNLLITPYDTLSARKLRIANVKKKETPLKYVLSENANI